MFNCELDACRAAERAGAVLGHVVVGRGPGRVHIHEYRRFGFAEAFGRDGKPLVAVHWSRGTRDYQWTPAVKRLSKAERLALSLALVGAGESKSADDVAASMPAGGE